MLKGLMKQAAAIQDVPTKKFAKGTVKQLKKLKKSNKCNGRLAKAALLLTTGTGVYIATR